jgi:hypothetical protein
VPLWERASELLGTQQAWVVQLLRCAAVCQYLIDKAQPPNHLRKKKPSLPLGRNCHKSAPLSQDVLLLLLLLLLQQRPWTWRCCWRWWSCTAKSAPLV